MPHDGALGSFSAHGTGEAVSENAEAMPQRMEAYRRYRSERAFVRGAKEMVSDGWAVELVRFLGLLSCSRGRMADVHYLR